MPRSTALRWRACPTPHAAAPCGPLRPVRRSPPGCGRRAAPAARGDPLPDNVGEAACADTNGLCYGGYGPSSCCPGYAYDRHTGTCYCCPDGVTGTGYGCRDLGVEQTMCDVAAILGLAATALNTAGTLALMTGVGAGLGIGLLLSRCRSLQWQQAERLLVSLCKGRCSKMKIWTTIRHNFRQDRAMYLLMGSCLMVTVVATVCNIAQRGWPL